MKKILFLIVFVCCAFSFCFDWPQDEVQPDSFHSYFGQQRGGTISTSLIFSDFSPVKSVDNGEVIAIISEHDDEMGMFESTLGNAVIVAHADDLLTVYANLDGDELPENLTELKSVSTGTNFGVSGNSGWQEGKSCLEFQLIDLKQNSSVNPRILMPRIGREVELLVGSVTAIARNGTVYPLRPQTTLPAGQYMLYRERQKTVIPYSTSVFVNGALVERITYDSLTQQNMRLCVQGNRGYNVNQVYPDKTNQLIADLTLYSGRNIIAVTVADILGAEKTASYVLTIN